MRRAPALALCAALAACGKTGPAHVAPRAPKAEDGPRPQAFVVAHLDSTNVLARDDDNLYWIDGKGIYQRPLGGPDAGKVHRMTAEIANWTEFVAFDAGHGWVAATDGNSVYAMRAGDDKLTVLAPEIGGVTDVALGEKDVAIAHGDEILVIPLENGKLRSLVTGQVHVNGIDVAGDHVYWTDSDTYSAEADPSIPGDGGVYRIAIAGGKVEQLAGGQRGPRGIEVFGDRVWWCTDTGRALLSAKRTGGGVHTELDSACDWFGIDDAGVIVHTPAGYLVEARHDGRDFVRMAPDFWYTPTGGPPLVAGDWIYTMAVNSQDGTGALLALPRDDRYPELVVPLHAAVSRAHVADGSLFWLEQKPDGSGYELWRGDIETGRRTRLTDHYGWPNDFALGGNEIYLTEDQTIYRVSAKGGGMTSFAYAENYLGSITVHRNHVLWIDGQSLIAQGRKKGERFAVVKNQGYGYGGTGGDFVFDDDFVYLTNFNGMSGVMRISENGHVELIYDGTQTYPSQDLALIGGDLYFWTGNEQTVYRLADGEATRIYRRTDGSISDMVEGGGLLYLSVTIGGYYGLVRLDPASGTGQDVLRWPVGESGAIAADESGAYVALEQLGAWVRLPHDVAPVADWKPAE